MDRIILDGLEYSIQLIRKTELAVDAPRIVVVSHLYNYVAQRLLQVCIQAIQRYTPEPHELWIVDNNSPQRNLDWLFEWPGINVVLNRTEPLPPEARNQDDQSPNRQINWGSYANAVALELASRIFNAEPYYLMTLHMDALPAASGWLSFLKSKISGNVRAAGIRIDRTRVPEGVLHVLGYMVDFRLFKQLDLDFFPELPKLDVGDRITIKLREAGYDVFACRNTVWEPELVDLLPSDSPFRNFHVDRAFDDEGNVIFLHLGRGVRRASGEHRKGVSAEEWVNFVSEYLL